MRFYLFCIASIVVLSSGCTTQLNADDSCVVSDVDRERLLQLPYAQFDQTENEGWRPLYASKCHAAAAQLLVDYIDVDSTRAVEHYMLPFHAGQLLAMAGRIDEAVPYFERSHTEEDSRIIDWNAFVDAHLAFIRRDRKQLLEMRARIDLQPALVAGPGTPEWAVGKKVNLDVVDGFLACFDKPFVVAYGTECRPD